MFLVAKNVNASGDASGPGRGLRARKTLELGVLKKMGRPRKGEHERRDERLALRLTTAEKSHLENQASQAGMNIAPYARNLILGNRLPVPARVSDAALLCELNRLGVLFNALADTRLTGCDPDEISSALAQFRDTLEKVGRDYGS